MKQFIALISVLLMALTLTAADTRPKLIITAKDVRPKSVKALDGSTVTFRFASKSPDEVKAYSLRPVQVMSDGKLVAETSIGAGLAYYGKDPGGLVLTFRTQQEAQAALLALAGNPAK